jgi:superoxide dismutase
MRTGIAAVKPRGRLMEMIEKSFGGYEGVKKAFVQTATGRCYT